MYVTKHHNNMLPSVQSTHQLRVERGIDAYMHVVFERRINGQLDNERRICLDAEGNVNV